MKSFPITQFLLDYIEKIDIVNGMKIKMHYMFGKKQIVACGKGNVLTTTNYKEITCKRCLRTREHKKVKSITNGLQAL